MERLQAQLQGITAIYGGSFNPPHSGHQMAVLYLLETLGAEAVWLIPAANHPFGKDLVDFEHRRAMCEAMVRPFGERVEVSSVEQELGGAGRTYDTLTHLRARYPDRPMTLVVGADILEEADRWYRWDDIELMVPVTVLGRVGYPNPRALELALPEVASQDLRRQLRDGEDVGGLVPSEVMAYIRAHGLYGAT